MKKNIYQGILRANPRGFGFVSITSSQMPDVFIPKSDMDKAIDGDTVEIEITKTSKKGPEGIILKILKREKTHFAGIIWTKDKKNYIAYIPMLGADRLAIVRSNKNLKIGDRVILKAIKWEKDLICEVTKLLSNISDATKDTQAAMAEFQIRSDFSKQIKNDVKNLTISKKDLLNRKDLTYLETITIDPESARDFDDSISLTKDDENIFHLGVHITDVAHFVKANSALDIEASLRGNSTYFPDICIPMLPKELSKELCSLQENNLRLTISVMMDFSQKGDLISYDIFRSFIVNKKRYTYENAKKELDSSKKSHHKKLLKTMVELCLLLKQKRFERGSIDFSMSDYRLKIESSGIPEEIEIVEYDITHQMIEEFMLKANEIVAEHLSKRKKQIIYRIHEEPSIETFKDFFDLARSLGFFLPPNPTLQDLQKLFIQAKKTSYLQLLSISFIKNLKLAAYSPENLGHFGLALEYYTHFTSPIRRYSDLIVQRILFDEENKNIDLVEIAKNCSEKERNSFRAESSVKTLKKLRFLRKQLKKNPNAIFSASITKVKSFGIYFELDNFFVDGFLHVSQLFDDYYEYFQKTLSLIGKRTGKILSTGEKIKVKILSIDYIIQEIQYKFVKKDKR